MTKFDLSSLLILTFLLTFLSSEVFSQRPYWQQHISYQMEVDMDVNTHRFEGTQHLVYKNNSPDTLRRAFYHLYFNAFQPGSMMDVRSRTIADPDRRVRDRIFQLAPHEIGYQEIHELKQDDMACTYKVVGTILEVDLAKPILPGEETVFNMVFEGQVPVQIRRSGRNNKEEIAYSMAQWYPKLCEYDDQGWHPNPYIGREFYGVWGDFDVKITIDSSFVVAASGYLQNPESIGHGYLPKGKKLKRPKSDKLTWHFVAPNVHDFLWAADPDYTHTTFQVPDGPLLHFFFQDNAFTEPWHELPAYAVKAFQYISEHFGKYPYDKYSIIQGGDGGMEYPMATLITGHRPLRSLVSVTVHEALHSWYQMVLGTNESLYPWMDEGFTSYASNLTMNHLFPPSKPDKQSHASRYTKYFTVVDDGEEEPMSMHSDHYHLNRAYSMSAYSKGAITLAQLGYIMGEETRDRALLRYFNTWKFKHPTPDDFLRIMEKESGMVLDWYLENWMNTTRTIDYGIQRVRGNSDSTEITIERVGEMMMPIDLLVTYKDGTKEIHYLPLRMMRGSKPNENTDPMTARVEHEAWPWTHPVYEVGIARDVNDIKSIEIDPSMRMADVDRDNNYLEPSRKFRFYLKPAAAAFKGR